MKTLAAAAALLAAQQASAFVCPPSTRSTTPKARSPSAAFTGGAGGGAGAPVHARPQTLGAARTVPRAAATTVGRGDGRPCKAASRSASFARPRRSVSLAASASSGTEYTSNRGLVFPTDKEEGWFDSATVGSPRVHRYYHDEGNRWVMWYHGQDTEWGKEGEGVMDIGTGRIGRAESTDGLTWTRTAGQMPLSSVLDKNTEQWWGFDTAHVGLGDVNLGASSRVATESSVYFMYYFGGDYEETDVEAEFGLRNPVVTGDSNAPPKGVRLRIGVALSQDGLNWCRVEGEHPTGACVDVGGEGQWDRLFVGWPVVLNHKELEFRMYYHALDPDTKKFTVGMATSQDGLAWQKKGPVFDGGGPGAFDEMGAGRRRIVMHNGVYHMVYEGIDKEGVHSLGLATSKDGVEWERHSDKPVFERSPPGSGAWDAGGVSNPEIVETDGGMWYLYYTGYPEKSPGEAPQGRGAEGGGVWTRCAIGVAVAVGNDLTKWTRLET